MAKTAIVLAVLLTAALLMPGALCAGDGDYEKGVAYLRAGNAAEAIRLLEPLTAKKPSDPYLQYHLGLAYYKAGRLDDACGSLAKTRSMAGDKAEEEFRLSVAFSNLGIGYYRQKKYDKALACFKDALSLDKSDGESRYYSGLARIEKGDYAGAVAELRQAAVLKSGDPKAQAAVDNAVGLAFTRQDKNAAAIEEFNKTLLIDPDNIEALYYLGTLNYKENGYAAAKPYFDKITKKGAPDDKTKKALFTTFFNMGVDFQNRDMALPAVESFDKALVINPDDPDAHFYRGYNLMALERYEEALSEFKEALALKPGMARAEAQREVAGKFAAKKSLDNAKERMSKGDFYAALPLFEKAEYLDPSSAEARKGHEDAAARAEADTGLRMKSAREAMNRGDYLQAVDETTELVRLNPASRAAAGLDKEVRSKLASVVDDYMRKGGEAERRGVLGEAVRHYETVTKLAPKNREAADALKRDKDKIDDTRRRAKRASEDGQLAAARDAYETLAKYIPGDVSAEEGLSDVRTRIGQEVDRSIEKARDALSTDDYDTAAVNVARALELSPKNDAALSLKSKISAHTTDSVKHEAVSGEGDEKVRRLYLSGVEHYTKGELKEAIADWREVLRMDPGNDKAKSSISKAEDKMKQTSN